MFGFCVRVCLCVSEADGQPINSGQISIWSSVKMGSMFNQIADLRQTQRGSDTKTKHTQCLRSLIISLWSCVLMIVFYSSNGCAWIHMSEDKQEFANFMQITLSDWLRNEHLHDVTAVIFRLVWSKRTWESKHPQWYLFLWYPPHSDIEPAVLSPPVSLFAGHRVQVSAWPPAE